MGKVMVKAAMVSFGIGLAVFLALGSLAACCKPQPQGIPVVDIDAADAGDPDAGGPDDTDPDAARVPACARACRTLKKLRCPEAQKPDGGLTCYAVCEKAELSGNRSLSPECVAAAGSVESVRACKTPSGSQAVRCIW